MNDTPLARYAFRRSVLEQERWYSLHRDYLVVEGGGQPSVFYPLAEVRMVHLKYEHTKQRGYYQCFIHTKRGRVSIRHVHFVSFGKFEDRSRTYTPFVKALLAELARFPGVRFKAGSTVNFVAAILGIPLLFGLGYLAVSMNKIGMAVFAAMMALLCAVMIVPSMPRRVDPHAPPAGLLPE